MNQSYEKQSQSTILKFKTKPLEFVISYAPYSNSSLNFFPYSCASWLKAKTTLSVSGPSSFSEQL